MARIRYTMNKYSIHNMNVGTACWVDVTFINNPHSFYVRPKPYALHLPYLQARGEKIEASEIKLGDIHIFKSRMLRCYARGKVIHIQGGAEPLYKLLAIDYGCVEKEVSIHRIWQCYHKSNIPGMVTHCQLSDCLPLGPTWDEDAIDAMKAYVQGERAKIIIRSRGPGPIGVEMINSCPDDIATLLAVTGYSIFQNVYNSPMEYPMMVPHYSSPRRLKAKTPLHVRLMSGIFPENFHVILVEEYQSYMQDRNDFRYYSQKQEPIVMEDLSVGLPVASFHNAENEFERGIIKEMYPLTSKVRLKLVDRGTEVVDHVSKLVPVPAWYIRIPSRAIHCTIHKSQLATAKSLSQFANKYGEFLVSIEELHQSFGPHSVIVARLPG